MTPDPTLAFQLHLDELSAPIELACALPAPYRLVAVPRYPEPQFKEAVHRTFQTATGTLDPAMLGVSERHLPWRKERHRSTPQLRLAALHGDDLAAWCFCLATRIDTLHMASSAVLEPHRRRGLYTAMANAVIGLARDAGYNALSSHHVATNNSILIAKLKLDFHILGVELDARNGVLISMEYPLSEARRAVLRARSGEVRIPAALAAQLGE